MTSMLQNLFSMAVKFQATEYYYLCVSNDDRVITICL